MPDNTTSSAAEMPQFSMPDFPPLVSAQPDPAWPLGQWCQFILLRYMQDLLAQREVVWRNEQVEGVHQIRVSARRLRTALQTFHALWEPAQVRKHSRYLAEFADTFGVARDLDVMIIYLDSQLHGAHRERRAALNWMLESKRRLRLAQQPELEEALRRLEADEYPRRFVELFSSKPFDIRSGGGQP
ncbi:MAG: CHAD domain-containing protein [bacterium]